MLWQSGLFRANESVPERMLDSIDLEREKGITIMAKNTAITYRGRPHQHRGHAGPRRFRLGGGADADAGGRRAAAGGRRRGPAAPDPLRPQEGPGGRAAPHRGRQQDRPQPTLVRPRSWTRSTTSSSTSTPPRTSWTFPSSTPTPARARPRASFPSRGQSLEPLFETDPGHGAAAELRSGMRAAVPRRHAGLGRLRRAPRHRPHRQRPRARRPTAWPSSTATAPSSLPRSPCSTAMRASSAWRSPRPGPGDLVAIAGIEAIEIGETIADAENPQALALIRIDEPTVSMLFSSNTSPFAGREGRFVTSRSYASACSRKGASTSASGWRRRTRPTPSGSPAAASCSWRSSSR